MNITHYFGGKITQPGIYAGVPMDRYHSGDICDGPSISSSGLRTIEGQSPAHYWAYSPLNPLRHEPKPKDEFDFGRAAHHLLLGEADFARHFAVRPDKWNDYRTDAAKNWRDDCRAHGYTPITPDDLTAIRGMAAALQSVPLASALLTGEAELSIFWKDARTGVWLKSRPDAIPAIGEALADYKTVVDASDLGCMKSMTNFGYAMQMALASEGLYQVTGRRIDDDAHILIFQEKTPPYAVNIKSVAPEVITLARGQVRRAIDTFARCLEAGEWPAYGSADCAPLYLTSAVMDRLKREAEAGLLPDPDMHATKEAAE